MNQPSQKNLGCYIPKRYILALLGFLGFFNVFAMRVNLNVALVAMVNTTNEEPSNNSRLTTECPALNHNNEQQLQEKNLKGEQYNWDPTTQGTIMGSFFYGYFVAVLTGGYLAERFGAKRMFGGGILMTAIFTLLTPLAVKWGLIPFIALRALEGAGEGMTFPAINALISRWSPKQERSRMSATIFGGGSVGTVTSLTISGWLCSTDFLGGWPSVFYVFGAISCIWVVFWYILISETPSTHPGISDEELMLFVALQEETQVSQKRPDVLWMKVITSVHMWAVLIAHIGSFFGQSLLIQELPTYLSGVLHFSVEASGMVTGLPSILECVGGWMASFVADKIITSGRLSITTVRKIFNSIALYGAGLCVLGIALSGCRPWHVITIFTIFMWLNGFKFSGYNVSHVDMCPLIAGTLYGITNGAACLTGIIGPAMTGAFTASGATLHNWSNVYYITVAVYFVSATIYAAFASSEVQPWIKNRSDKNISMEKKS